MAGLAAHARHAVAGSQGPDWVITAGLAAVSSLNVPLTHREHAHGVVFVTGHAKPGDSGTDWRQLAATARDAKLTLVIYMGVATGDAIAEKLIADGLSPDTPVAVLEKGTRADMRTLRASSSEAARFAADLFAHRVVREVGALSACIGGLDVLAFTGGTRTLGAGASATGGGRLEVSAGTVDINTALTPGALLFQTSGGTLNFNHTGTDYLFASSMSGAGSINHAAGTTRLTGDSLAFTGTTSVAGGTLFVDGHGRQVTLRARVVDEDNSSVLLRFEVQDTGIGIAPAQLPLLFQPFAQA